MLTDSQHRAIADPFHHTSDRSQSFCQLQHFALDCDLLALYGRSKVRDIEIPRHSRMLPSILASKDGHARSVVEESCYCATMCAFGGSVVATQERDGERPSDLGIARSGLFGH